MAVSVPSAPMAKPMSARASAGASLMPSPTMPTTPWAARSTRPPASLSSGNWLPRTSSMPTSRGDGLRGLRVVAGQHHGADTQRMQFGDRVAAARLDGVGHREQRQHAGRVDQQDHRLALALQGLQPRAAVPAWPGPGPAPGGGCPGSRAGRRSRPRTPRPGRASKSLTSCSARCRRRLAARAIACDTGWSERPARLAASRRNGDRSGVVATARRAASKSVCTGLPWVRCRSCPAPASVSLRPCSRIDTALDQDALARGRGQAADDGHRCRDDQRAGAGDDQQHQRLVDPVAPVRPGQQRRHDGHEQRRSRTPAGV